MTQWVWNSEQKFCQQQYFPLWEITHKERIERNQEWGEETDQQSLVLAGLDDPQSIISAVVWYHLVSLF